MSSGDHKFQAARPPRAGAHSQIGTKRSLPVGVVRVAVRRDTRDKQNQGAAGNMGKWG